VSRRRTGNRKGLTSTRTQSVYGTTSWCLAVEHRCCLTLKAVAETGILWRCSLENRKGVRPVKKPTEAIPKDYLLGTKPNLTLEKQAG